MTTYQQLTSNKEALHRQLLKQTQLVEQQQHEEVQGEMALEMPHQERLEATSQDYQQLQAQLSLLAVPKERGGVDKMKRLPSLMSPSWRTKTAQKPWWHFLVPLSPELRKRRPGARGS
jgi:hypothetical protein|uniref:Golgin subfamily A member 2-like n=1 Tax=Castor canadensis TaxID=51338 RepID=A0A8B7VPI2_CASCN|nr:golgin subfamily A member 2-like [Castor canadensis]